MIISLIVAVSENNAIGRAGQLPWHLPEDLKYFKRTTIGRPVLMGRKTFASLGRALPGRLNIVVSGNRQLQLPEGVLLYHTLDEAVERMQHEDGDEGFIIGGGEVFAAAMQLADRMYITRVHTETENADAWFPAIDHTHWRLSHEEAHEADDKHAHAYTFQQYERIAL